MMRIRQAIKFLSSSKKVLCLPSGNPRDLFPVLEAVSHTHTHTEWVLSSFLDSKQGYAWGSPEIRVYPKDNH